MPIEDLTTYVEHDIAADRLAVTSSQVSATTHYRDEPCWLSKDFGQDHFNAIDTTFALSIASATADGSVAMVRFAASDGRFGSSQGANDINVMMNKEASGYRFYMCRGYYLEEAATPFSYSAGTWYYCTLTREAGSSIVTLKTYSDEARSNLLHTLSLTGFSTSARWRWLVAYSNREHTSHIEPTTGSIKDIDLHEAAATPMAVYVHHLREEGVA